MNTPELIIGLSTAAAVNAALLSAAPICRRIPVGQTTLYDAINNHVDARARAKSSQRAARLALRELGNSRDPEYSAIIASGLVLQSQDSQDSGQNP